MSSTVRIIEPYLPAKKNPPPVAMSPPVRFFASCLPAKKILPLPAPPLANLKESRVALKNAMVKSDLAVREVDELQEVTQRFRLRVLEWEKEELAREKQELVDRLPQLVAPGVDELVTEKKRRHATGQRVQELLVENRKLKDALQLLL